MSEPAVGWRAMSQSADQAPRRALCTDRIPRNPVRALLSPFLWLATVHLLTDLFVAIVTFTFVVVMLSLSFSLLFVFLLGVPVWVLTVFVVRGLSSFERARFRLTMGMSVPAPALPERRPFFSYAWALLRSATVWRQIGYHLALLPWGAVTFTVTLLAWSGPLMLLGLPLYADRLPSGHADLGLFVVGDERTALPMAAVGLLLLVAVAPAVVSGLATADAALCRALLGSLGTEELVERVDELENSRRRVVDAGEAERRRIERDLHDGAQQRLVSLAMTLGRAKARAGDEVDDATRQLLDEAHQEAKLAIVELRDLTRGLHPPVLADRGIDAALSALAARSPVPVDVEVDVGVRPSPTVEAIAYFVVAEALTNVAKHSGARRASVVLRRTGETLRVVVRDDGQGGADVNAGSGLRGMADRVAGVDGRLHLNSPLGGPTVLTVDLPCEW